MNLLLAYLICLSGLFKGAKVKTTDLITKNNTALYPIFNQIHTFIGTMFLFCTMFTGIIECTGKIEAISQNGSNRSFRISSPISNQLKVDQSVSHDGVCLTVEKVEENCHTVTAIDETLTKTNLSKYEAGDILNLERCMQMNGRIDGHLVQGHIDSTAICINILDKNGSYNYRFQFPEKFASLIIEKGSIAVNGISLTIFDISKNEFSVSVIPYTFEHTNLKFLKVNAEVNIEFDMMGKYIQRNLFLSGSEYVPGYLQC